MSDKPNITIPFDYYLYLEWKHKLRDKTTLDTDAANRIKEQIPDFERFCYLEPVEGATTFILWTVEDWKKSEGHKAKLSATMQAVKAEFDAKQAKRDAALEKLVKLKGGNKQQAQALLVEIESDLETWNALATKIGLIP